MVALGDADVLTTLSAVAAVVWEALARPGDVDRIGAFVADLLEVPPADVAGGLETCLRDLTAAGVIEREGSAAWA